MVATMLAENSIALSLKNENNFAHGLDAFRPSAAALARMADMAIGPLLAGDSASHRLIGLAKPLAA